MTSSLTAYPGSAPASEALLERARTVIPGGVNSPVRAFRSVGGTPRFTERAQGPWLWDADGRRYVDLVCSWGPMILGHAHPDVLAAVNDAELSNGEVDADGAPITAQQAQASGHAHGPMADWQKKRIEVITDAFYGNIKALAAEFGRSERAIFEEAKLALQLTRKPQLYNCYLSWWAATKWPKNSEGGDVLDSPASDTCS